MITLYIDADACPVKQEVYRVAERHALKGTALKVFGISNSPPHGVMAGLVPAIHVFLPWGQQRRGCPRQARA
jgi:uncharacterized protein YaiI (UPF0178 family)